MCPGRQKPLCNVTAWVLMKILPGYQAFGDVHTCVCVCVCVCVWCVCVCVTERERPRQRNTGRAYSGTLCVCEGQAIVFISLKGPLE